MSKKKAAYENPLIPNARLRQMYRAILRAHLLGQALPPAQRALTATREAALVSTALDLTSRDLVLDAFSSPVLDFLRGTPLNRALHPKGKSGADRILPGRVISDCGSASRLPAPADVTARIWSVVGAAAALQSDAHAKKAATESSPESTGATAKDSSVVIAYALPDQISAALWRAALSFASQRDLPIIFVVLPASHTQKRSALAAKNGESIDLRTIAHHARVPALPVDADDPVALYRVAQESIGHARIGGGPALIHCISFSAEPPTLKPASPVAAIANLESYLLHRRIATKRWMESEAASFATQVGRLKAASK